MSGSAPRRIDIVVTLDNGTTHTFPADYPRITATETVQLAVPHGCLTCGHLFAEVVAPAENELEA